MARLKLSPPWVAYYKKLNALFEKDEDIMVIYDEDKMEVKLYCTDEDKTEALSFLLPETVSFGSAELKITIVPSNEKGIGFIKGYNITITDYETAMCVLFGEGNKHVETVEVIPTPFGDFTYVIFRKEVIQYYEDNISDFYGNRSTLCEDIAREVFKNIEGVFFCTNIN